MCEFRIARLPIMIGQIACGRAFPCRMRLLEKIDGLVGLRTSIRLLL